jgi:hypothetical protein
MSSHSGTVQIHVCVGRGFPARSAIWLVSVADRSLEDGAESILIVMTDPSADAARVLGIATPPAVRITLA